MSRHPARRRRLGFGSVRLGPDPSRIPASVSDSCPVFFMRVRFPDGYTRYDILARSWSLGSATMDGVVLLRIEFRNSLEILPAEKRR